MWLFFVLVVGIVVLRFTRSATLPLPNNSPCSISNCWARRASNFLGVSLNGRASSVVPLGSVVGVVGVVGVEGVLVLLLLSLVVLLTLLLLLFVVLVVAGMLFFFGGLELKAALLVGAGVLLSLLSFLFFLATSLALLSLSLEEELLLLLLLSLSLLPLLLSLLSLLLLLLSLSLPLLLLLELDSLEDLLSLWFWLFVFVGLSFPSRVFTGEGISFSSVRLRGEEGVSV